MANRKRTLALVLAVGVLIGGLLVWIAANRPVPADMEAAVRKRVEELKAEAGADSPARRVLRGEPQPGNAWEEYNAALKDLRSGDEGNLFVFFLYATGRPEIDRSVVEPMVIKRAGALEHLHQGSQRQDGRYPYKWDKAWLEEPLDRGMIWRLATLAAAQSRLLTEDGKPRDAADVLLDLTVFARDLMTNSPVSSSIAGYQVYGHAFNGLRSLVQSGKLTRSELAALGKSLEIIDNDFPTLQSVFAYENLPFGEWLVTQNSNQDLSLTRRAETYFESVALTIDSKDWRMAIAPAPTKLEVFELKENLLKRIAPLDNMKFTEALKEAEAITNDAESSLNRLLASSMPNVPAILRTHRGNLTRLRLLRAAVSLLAGGQMPPLEDPLGDKLFLGEENGKVKIWSAGRDVVFPNGGPNWQRESEMVLEISKPQ